ncbi:hypothetical protein GCM10027348_41760 [Hymenobacter tenuis]
MGVRVQGRVPDAIQAATPHEQNVRLARHLYPKVSPARTGVGTQLHRVAGRYVWDASHRNNKQQGGRAKKLTEGVHKQELDMYSRERAGGSRQGKRFLL